MTTLTYRENPSSYEEVRSDFVRFTDRIRAKYGKLEYGWLLEFQLRGAAHFHIFWSDNCNLSRAITGEAVIKRTRKGKSRKLCAGPTGDYLAETWISIVGDTDERFLRFQRGGITELMENPDGAGRYAAKEAAKRVQKKAPWKVSQWWGMSKSLKPVIREQTSLTVAEFIERFPESQALARNWKRLEI